MGKDHSILNVQAVKDELEAQDWEFERFEGCYTRRVYLGTVFSLMPSGKFYMPWARSNVAGCPGCDGEGTVHNRHADERKHAKLKRERSRLTSLALDNYGAWVSGKWPDGLKARISRCDRLMEYFQPTKACDFCGGLGSFEAHLDELAQAALEAELEQIGAFLESGEGDLCDLFAVQSRDSNPDEELVDEEEEIEE